MKAEIIVKLKIDKHEVSLTLSEVKELYNQLKELVDKQIQYYPVYPPYSRYRWDYDPCFKEWVSTGTASCDSVSVGTGEISYTSLCGVAE